MDLKLDAIEARVLGCLIEKEMSTPDYYPLSLNALTNAANQKQNRDPVMSIDERQAARALEGLRAKQLAYESGGGRVAKYGQNFGRLHNLIGAEAAVMAELLLRGPRTAGELRSRTERMHGFESIDGVEEALSSLLELGMAIKLPKMPGRKESRYAHLLSGEPEPTELESAGPPPGSAVAAVRAENERIAALEEEVSALKTRLAGLEADLEAFKAQFE